MVVVLSYIFAIIITMMLAIILYPIAALFWIMGLFGKVADVMFRFTKKVISSLWKDILNVSNTDVNGIVNSNNWTCSCGVVNTGKFCSECGGVKPELIACESEIIDKKDEIIISDSEEV